MKMRISFYKYLFTIVIAGVFIFSCVKKKSYPTIPEVDYKDFVYFTGDSADLTATFTDGNGDIGVSEGDSTRTFWYTYYYFDTITQKYRAYYNQLFNDTLRIGYIVNKPNDSYKDKPISGEIKVRMQKFRHITQIKKVKYVFYLYDAAGNKSNVITSPELIVQ